MNIMTNFEMPVINPARERILARGVDIIIRPVHPLLMSQLKRWRRTNSYPPYVKVEVVKERFLWYYDLRVGRHAVVDFYRGEIITWREEVIMQ